MSENTEQPKEDKITEPLRPLPTRGHLFNEACECARCKKSRLKKIRDMSVNASIVNNYIENLPVDKVLFTYNDELLSLMNEKMIRLKSKYSTFTKPKEFTEKIIYDALTHYLKSL